MTGLNINKDVKEELRVYKDMFEHKHGDSKHASIITVELGDDKLDKLIEEIEHKTVSINDYLRPVKEMNDALLDLSDKLIHGFLMGSSLFGYRNPYSDIDLCLYVNDYLDIVSFMRNMRNKGWGVTLSHQPGKDYKLIPSIELDQTGYFNRFVHLVKCIGDDGVSFHLMFVVQPVHEKVREIVYKAYVEKYAQHILLYTVLKHYPDVTEGIRITKGSTNASGSSIYQGLITDFLGLDKDQIR